MTSIIPIDLFPLAIAKGKAFCNRVTETKKLKTCISEKDYAEHIQHAAMITWKAQMSPQSLDCLFNYSERHPYYLNLLCSRMIFEKEIPTPEIVRKIWQQYVMEERSSVASEIELLSKNQRKLLTILSRTHKTNSPLGHEFIQIANMSKATIDQSLSFLERQDYIFKDEYGFVHVLDPLIKTVLSGTSQPL